MAITVTAKHASVLGTSSAQTRSSASASYASGSRVLVVAHGLSDGHTNGLGTGGTGWSVTDNAATNDPTWTLLDVSPIDSSLGANYRVQTAMFLSSPLTATESFTVTIDAHTGGTGLFFYGIQTVEVVGASGTLVQSDGGNDADGNASITFPSTPAGFQLLAGYAVASHDTISWSAAPTNFALLASSTATPNGGTGCAIVTSTTNTATGVSWGWTVSGGTALVTTLLAVELADATAGTNVNVPNAATAVGAARAPAVAVRPNAGVAAAAPAARQPRAAISARAGTGTAAAAAQSPAVRVDTRPGPSSATGTAHTPAARVATTAGTATGAAAAPAPTARVAPNAGTSTAAGAAHDATTSSTAVTNATAEAATATAAASSAAVAVLTRPAAATATAGAHNPTVDTGASGAAYTDNFDRADSADLGADWTPVAGGMRIDGNEAYIGTLGSTAGVLHRERHSGTLAVDHYAQADITQLSAGGYSDLRIMVRWTGTDSFYELRVNNAGEWYVNRVTSGGETDITSGTGLTLALPETWRLEVEGTGATVTLTVKRNGSTVATYDDTAGSRIISGANAGIGGYTAGGSPPDATLDNYASGDLGGPVEANAAVAAAAAAAPSPAVRVAPNAGVATAAGAARWDAGSSVSLNLVGDTAIALNAAAHDASTSTSASTNAAAGTGTATAGAHNPRVAVLAGALAATAVAAAAAAVLQLLARAGTAVAVPAARAPAVDIRPAARVATATGAAPSAAVAVLARPAAATAVAAAYAPTLDGADVAAIPNGAVRARIDASSGVRAVLSSSVGVRARLIT